MLNTILQKIEKLPRLPVIVIAHCLYYICYFLTNQLKVFRLHELPFIFGEEKIPLMEWTAIVYLSAAIMAPLAMLVVKREALGKIIVYGAGLVAVAMTAFVLYPVAYPREITDNFLLGFVRSVDAPSNCCPSLHVAACVFLSLCLWRINGRRTGLLFLLWSTAIIVSTLTTKQHYVIDILAGGILAVVFAWLATKSQKR